MSNIFHRKGLYVNYFSEWPPFRSRAGYGAEPRLTRRGYNPKRLLFVC
jgi:hypothetical protein